MNSPRLRFKDDDGREFPEWEEKQLGDLCLTFKSGSGITSEQISDSAEYPVYGGNGLRGYTNTYTHDGFFVLIGRQGALCGNINRSRDKAYISEHAIAVNANETSNTEWLAYKLDCVKLNRLSESSTQPGLSVNKLLLLKLVVPAKPERTKIASFLTTIDEKISQLTQKYDLIKQYKKGVMQQIFSQKLRFKDDDGRESPGRGVKLLGEISKFLDGRRKPIKESDRLKMKEPYPYYGVSGIIDYVNDYIFDEDIILLGEDGENIVSRNLPLAFKVSGKCWVNNHAHVIKPNHSTNIDFLTQYLDSIFYIKYNTGTAQPKLNQEVCRTIPLNLPCLFEQTKIANFLTAIDDKITHTKTQLNAVKLYKKGLLQQMFV